MATTRRDFLRKGGLVALAAGVPIGLAEKALGKEALISSTPTPTAFALNKSAFTAQLNTRFNIHRKGSKVPVKLVEVADLNSQPVARHGKEGFTLLFRGDRGTPLKQDTYLIEHNKLGAFSFLIVPVKTSDENAPSYEAVINRLYP